MIKMVKVVALKPMGEHLLWMQFSDGSEGVRDFADVIAEGGPMVERCATLVLRQGVYLVRRAKLAERIRCRRHQSSYGNGQGRRLEIGVGGVTQIVMPGHLP